MLCQIQYNQMQRRQYLNSGALTRRHLPCIICNQLQKSSNSYIPLHSRILINKYRHPSQKSRQIQLITHLIATRQPSVDLINYKYALQQIVTSQQLTQYRNFQNIVALIKPLIIERTNKDVNPIISFHDPKDYEALMRRYRYTRLLKKKKPQFKCILPNVLPKNGSGTSTDEDLYSSPSKSNKRANQQQNKPPETETVHRMTRNLSNMLRKYEQHQQFHPSQIFDLIDSVPGHMLDITELEKQFKFKRDLLQNFSIIEEQEKPVPKFTTKPLKKVNTQAVERLHTGPVERLKTETIERLQTENCCMEGNHYGFKNRGDVVFSRNVNKQLSRDVCKKENSKSRQKWMKENQSPNLRVHTDYDCQFIKKQKKRSINSKKLSKGVSPSLKSLGSSKDKLKLTGSRSKLFKKY